MNIKELENLIELTYHPEIASKNILRNLLELIAEDIKQKTLKEISNAAKEISSREFANIAKHDEKNPITSLGNKVYRRKICQEFNGDYFIELPEEICKELKLQADDVIDFEIVYDRIAVLKKVS